MVPKKELDYNHWKFRNCYFENQFHIMYFNKIKEK